MGAGVDVLAEAFVDGVDAAWAVVDEDDFASRVDDTSQGVVPVLNVVEHVAGEDEVVVLVWDVGGRVAFEEAEGEVGCEEGRVVELIELGLIGVDAGVVDVETHGVEHSDQALAHVAEAAA